MELVKLLESDILRIWWLQPVWATAAIIRLGYELMLGTAQWKTTYYMFEVLYLTSEPYKKMVNENKVTQVLGWKQKGQ